MSPYHHQDAALYCIWIEKLFCWSEIAQHMRVACSRRICSQRRRWTTAHSASIPSLTQFLQPPPPNPNHVLHGPWLEPGNRYKSWGAKALSPTCESRVADLNGWGHLTGDFGHIRSSSVDEISTNVLFFLGFLCLYDVYVVMFVWNIISLAKCITLTSFYSIESDINKHLY